MDRIVVYTMTGCPHCAALKAFLTEKGIEFTEKDVAVDDDALAEFRRLGFRGTPAIVVGERSVVGFNREKVSELLGL